MLYYKLPFYGKRGSIGEIKEFKSRFEVSVYNIDGKKNDNVLTIKNNFNNKRDLLANFFCDVEEYLSKFQGDFMKLSKVDKKLVLNKKVAVLILILSVLIGIGVPAVGILLGSANLWTLGLISLAFGASFSTASLISLKNAIENEKIDDFLRIYSNLNHELNIYKEETKLLNNKNNNIKRRCLSPSVYDREKQSALIKTRKQ